LGCGALILRQAVAEKRPFLPDITFQAIEQARLVAEKNTTGQRVHLPGDLRLVVDYDRLLITDDEDIQLDDWPQMGQKKPQIIACSWSGRTGKWLDDRGRCCGSRRSASNSKAIG
jgi:hypothetical protein